MTMRRRRRIWDARERAAQVGEGRRGASARRRFRVRAGCEPDDAEVARLKRELAKTQGRARHSKKSHRLLREGTAVRFQFIAKHRGIWRVQ